MDTVRKSIAQSELNLQFPRLSFHFATADDILNQEPQLVPFFKSQSRRTTRDTWLISLLVLLQIVVFVTTMAVNEFANSRGDCVAAGLGRLSFQPFSENPLLGPSASTLDGLGALRRMLIAQNHHTWRLLTCPWLHAGAIHLIINLGSIIFVGVYMEQEFGPFRIGMIYILSASVGSLFSALFVRNSPAVCSSGALFGLVGAMLSSLARNWNSYSNKVPGLVLICLILTMNFLIGFLPYVDNFSNIGGLLSGFLLGLALLFTPKLRQVAQHKAGLFEYGIKSSLKLKEKLDKPVLRALSFLLFSLILAGCSVAVLYGINVNQYCGWCQYIDCVPSQSWSCNEITSSCEKMVSENELTLTCPSNGNFRILPCTNISESRARDLCTLICS